MGEVVTRKASNISIATAIFKYRKSLILEKDIKDDTHREIEA